MSKKDEKLSSKNLSPVKASVLNVELGDLGEPIAKLIEVAADYLGKRREPKSIREKAKAQAEADLIHAETEIKIAKMKFEGSVELQEMALRASSRINTLELRRQQNIESIVEQAVHQLPESASEEKVDEDWVAQFFNYAQDVSNEEMQKLWAKILAGEVAQPRSYSSRTLNTVRMLTQDEARLFEFLCKYIWKEKDDSFFKSKLLFRDEVVDKYLNSRGLFYLDFVHFESIGLMWIERQAGIMLKAGTEQEFDYFGKWHRVTNPRSGINYISLHAYTLTHIGRELASLCDCEPDEEYRSLIVKRWEDAGVEVQIIEPEE